MGLKITVYCSSSSRIPEVYLDLAFELGKQLAEKRHTLIYGGGGIGSMKRLADGSLSRGGRVIGIMPSFMKELEWAHPNLAEFVWTQNLSDRKQKLIDGTDAIIALPGGSGTWEELFEAFTLKRLNQIHCPIYLLNQNGFYDALLELMERAVGENFMSPDHLETWTVLTSLEELMMKL